MTVATTMPAIAATIATAASVTPSVRKDGRNRSYVRPAAPNDSSAWFSPLSCGHIVRGCCQMAASMAIWGSRSVAAATRIGV